MYRANLAIDLPHKWKAKRIIFYQKGLKIYGLIPHLLNRRLKGEFISNHLVISQGAFRGAGFLAPSGEDNYTVIPYAQKPEHAEMLLSWLYDGSGFEWAIAGPENWQDNIQEWNAYRRCPSTWVPANNEQGWRAGFQKALEGDQAALKALNQ